jgi:hypothetical protein
VEPRTYPPKFISLPETEEIDDLLDEHLRADAC